MQKKSIKINAILNAIRVGMTVVFPLITFPYATRVLGSVNIGKVQFGQSVIVYFSLIAALGVSSYGTREGAKLREDKEAFSRFANQIFTINMISTAISYLLLFAILLLPTKLQNYSELILIQSMTIIFTTLGVDWIYTVYEDFLYITTKTIMTQILSMVLLFIFVRSKNDYYIYAFITVVASSFVNVINFFHARKYCKLHLIKNNQFSKHIKPLLILFSNSLAIRVYINSDVLMLGFMSDDYHVGIYSVAVKIYNLIKELINAIIAVIIPRLAVLNVKEDKEDYYLLGEKVFHASIVLILPAILGLFLLSKNIILFISGSEYIEGTYALKILSFALGFAVLSNFFVNAVLIVNKEEKYVLMTTVAAALINVGLNFIMIPLFQERGAALTTVAAEFTVMFLGWRKGQKYIRIRKIPRTMIQALIGCIGIVGAYFLINSLHFGNFVTIVLTFILAVICYFLILIILRNKLVIDLLKQTINKMKSVLANR